MITKISSLQYHNSSTSVGSATLLKARHKELLEYQFEKKEKFDFSQARDFIRVCKESGKLIENYQERRLAQSLLDYWANELYRAKQEVIDTTLDKFDPQALPSFQDDQCPYVGLNPFKDDTFFFGRNRFVDHLIKHIKSNNLLAVVGTFASGKSSVVFGGLLPKLKDDVLPDSKNWLYLEMYPGSEPFASLEARIGNLNEQDKSKPKVLIIDHFEEIFTLCKADETRNKFIDSLLELLKSENPRNIVILIVQEENASSILKLEKFGSLFKRARVDVPMLDLEELRDAIDRPAKLIDLRLEKKLVDALVKDLVGDPSALPLLQFTMLKLWKKRIRNQISLESYEELVNNSYEILDYPRKVNHNLIHKILAGSAEEVYQTLSDKDQRNAEIAKDILKQIFKPVGKFEVQGGRISTQKLYQRGNKEEREKITQVLIQLIEAQLLRPIWDIRSDDGQVESDDRQVEIAHPSLKDDWPRLYKWLENHRRAQYLLDNLDVDIHRWKKYNRDEHYLTLTSATLEIVQDYISLYDIELDDEKKEYIKANEDYLRKVEKEKNTLKFKTIVQALVAHARLQQERYKENQRGALLAYQAYIFNQRYPNFSDAYLGALLSEILNASYFSRILEGHEGDIIPAIAFSSDGKTLASGSSDGTILLWDISSGRRETLDTQKNKIEIKSLVFHPKNRQWLVSGTTDGRVQLWDLSQTVSKPSNLYSHEGCPPENNKPEVWALAFNSDGTILASGSWDCTILLWDFQQQKLLRPLEGHNDFIWSVAFSPDGKTLASGSRDGTVLLWDLNQHKAQPQRLSVHQEEINHDYEVFSVAFSPDGTMLASGCRDRVVRLWTLQLSANNQSSANSWIASDSPVVLTSHYKEVRSVAFHPDPDTKLLASGSNDQTVRLWDLRSLTSKSSIVTSPSVLDCQDTGVSSVAFSSNGDFLAASSWNRKLELWDLRRPVTVLHGKSMIYSLAVSSDEKWVVWGDEAGNIKGWKQDLVNDHPPILGSHKKAVRSVAFSPDKQMLASGSLDGTVKLWQLNLLNNKITNLGLDLGYCEQGFQSVAFSKNGQWLAAGDRNRTVWVWNLREPRSTPFTVLHDLVSHDQREINWVCSVAFSPDSKMLASGHGDGTVQLWRVSQHSIKQEIVNGHNHHQQEVRAVAFSPYGRWLASASADRTIQLWDRQEEKLYVLYGANSGFSSISFSPKGDLMAVGCFDGTIWLWDVNHPYATPIVLPRRHNAGVSSVSFSSNGQKLVSGSHDGTVRLWNMNPESLANLICEKVQRNLTQDEWERFVDFRIDYLRTCPNLPSGKDAPPTPNAQSSEDWLKNTLPLTDL